MYENKQNHSLWKPHPGPQTMFLSCPVEDVLFGGARGGGKTDALIFDFIQHSGHYGGKARGILIRRSYPEFEEIESRCHEIFPKLTPEGSWEWKAMKRVWQHVSGSFLRLRFIEKDTDASKYQGHQYTWVGVDEMGSFPSPEPIDLIRACLRSPDPEVQKYFRGSANPGGVGHNWLKARYVDPAPANTAFWADDSEDQTGELLTQRMYIPSKLSDNPTIAQDTGYVNKIRAATANKPHLWKAWMFGDWNVIAGGMFDDIWDNYTHIVHPFKIPSSWYLDRSFDWGASKPFSIGWWAESDGSDVTMANGEKKTYPPGTLFRICEWYGWTGKPNKGVNLENYMIARGILEIEKSSIFIDSNGNKLHINPGPADANIWNGVQGKRIIDDFSKEGVQWVKADNRPGARITGWSRLRDMLCASTKENMEDPGMFVFSTCRNFIRTVPVLPRDEKKPDDVNTEVEDHVGDDVRYRVLSKSHLLKNARASGV